MQILTPCPCRFEVISRHTVQKWGADRAIRYLGEIQACIQGVAESPLMGRPCDRVKIGYRRIEQGRHVIFYRRQGDGIVVGRVLHQRMLPGNHTLEIVPYARSQSR